MLSILKGFKTSQRHADVQVCNVSVEKSHSCFKMAQAAGLLAECPGLLLTVPVCNSFLALGLCLTERFGLDGTCAGRLLQEGLRRPWCCFNRLHI